MSEFRPYARSREGLAVNQVFRRLGSEIERAQAMGAEAEPSRTVFTAADIPALEAELVDKIIREKAWANDPNNDEFPKPDNSLRHL
jgi:hypothetical protein